MCGIEAIAMFEAHMVSSDVQGKFLGRSEKNYLIQTRKPLGAGTLESLIANQKKGELKSILINCTLFM